MGYANFAFCIVDTDNVEMPLLWEKRRLWHGRGKPTANDCYRAVMDWCKKYSKMLAMCDCIVLEQQMRAHFQVMNTAVRALYDAKAQVVSPKTIASYYKLPLKREAKKAATIALIRKRFGEHAAPLDEHKKNDDLADAALLALYACDKAWDQIKAL